MVSQADSAANELKMPIAIHSRDADQETLDILKEEGCISQRAAELVPEEKGTGRRRTS